MTKPNASAPEVLPPKLLCPRCHGEGLEPEAILTAEVAAHLTDIESIFPDGVKQLRKTMDVRGRAHEVHLRIRSKPDVCMEVILLGVNRCVIRIFANSMQACTEVYQNIQIHLGLSPPHEESPVPVMFMIQPDGFSCYTESIAIRNPRAFSPAELSDQFGTALLAFDQSIQADLHQTQPGFSILTGPSGSGKSTYLRHLVTSCYQRNRFFFCTSDSLVEVFGTPSFLEFWRSELRRLSGTSVLLIDDADGLLGAGDLLDRSVQNNLLSLRTGLLGDALALHILFACRTPLKLLDPALCDLNVALNVVELPPINRGNSYP